MVQYLPQHPTTRLSIYEMGKTYNCIGLLEGHSDYISSVAFLADGSIASITLSGSGMLKPSTLEIANEDLAISFTFIPDTSKLLSIYETGVLSLLDV